MQCNYVDIKTKLKYLEEQLFDKDRNINELQTPGTVMCRE